MEMLRAVVDGGKMGKGKEKGEKGRSDKKIKEEWNECEIYGIRKRGKKKRNGKMIKNR